MEIIGILRDFEGFLGMVLKGFFGVVLKGF